MNFSLLCIRLFFIFLSIFFMATHTMSVSGAWTLNSALTGIIYGSIASCLLISLDVLFRRFRLRSLNLVIIGLFVGYLLAQGILHIFSLVLSFAMPVLSTEVLGIVKTTIMLSCLYLGIVITCRSSEELSLSIPFIKLQSSSKKNNNLIVTPSLLSDDRIIDVATSGLLDHRLIIPRFVIKELNSMVESHEEILNKKGSHALSIVKKLDSLPSLHLTYDDTYFPDAKDCNQKIIQLANMVSANILTSDMSTLNIDHESNIRVINMQTLANAFKPLLNSNESLFIKVQRYGKEPHQGIGYLDDGTMVVVNGGGEHIGQTIKSQVLSVKHTSSGRIIFCNATIEEEHVTLVTAKDFVSV